MKGKKTSLAQRKKVIRAKIENPEASLRDIEKETGVKRDTVANIIETVPEIVASSLDKGASLLETMREIVRGVAEITQSTVNNALQKKDKIDSKEAKTLNEIAEMNRKRLQILEGKPTDIHRHDIDFGKLTPKQLQDKINEAMK